MAGQAALIRVSRSSPFAHCKNGLPPADKAYTNAEVEPFVASGPASDGHPGELVGVWQQDRYPSGYSRGIMAASSADGGRTWTRVSLPFTVCTPGNSEQSAYATDPWVSIGPDGTVYATAVDGRYVYAAISHDGGKTWPVITQANTVYGSDKDSVTADPTRPGVAYIVRNTTAALFSRTTDGGVTWSPDIRMSPNNLSGDQILVDPRTDVLYDIAGIDTGMPHPDIALFRSADDGNTWSTPTMIAKDLSAGKSLGWPYPLRTARHIPTAAVDPVSGEIYVAWQDARFSHGRYDEIVLSHSADGGVTWSAPQRVNFTRGMECFNPAIAVNRAGVVGITYYALHSHQPHARHLPTDVIFTSSTSRGERFTASRTLATFDMRAAPYVTHRYFIGDYSGLTANGNSFVPFFVLAHAGNRSNPTDVYATKVSTGTARSL